MEIEKIVENAKKALQEERAIATGIGVFGALFNENKILLRRRLEKGSLIYPGDLSGKWELPGGIVELGDFGEEYQSVIENTLIREIKEEVGIVIERQYLNIVLLPAVLKKSSIEKRYLIDWAFVVPIKAVFEATPEYQDKLENGEIAWIPFGKLKEIEIVSERTKFLISMAIKYMQKVL